MADSKVTISVLKRGMVLPAQRPPHTHLFLSCLDIYWEDLPYNQLVVFYEGALPDDGRVGGAAALMERLKSSLALCLVHYYPFCGRLAKGSESPHRLFIDCSSHDDGVEFVEASASFPLSLLARDGFKMSPLFQQLCQLPHRQGGDNCPLLSIQATFFSDGGFALGFASSHVVADGQSMWDFKISWGECSRGVPLSSPPLHNRELLAGPHPSSEKAKWIWIPQIKEEDKEEERLQGHSLTKKGDDVEHTISINDRITENKNLKYIEGKQGNIAEMMNSKVPAIDAAGKEEDAKNVVMDGERAIDRGLRGEKMEPLTQCVFYLPDSAIQKLKIEAGGAHTSFEVMCAHFWKHLTAARENATRNFHQTTRLAASVDCRTRMTPPLPSSYFGNVVKAFAILSTGAAIRRETLCATACRVHDAVARITADVVKDLMNGLETNGATWAYNSLFAIMSSCKGIQAVSSPRFPAYRVDYGWGKPVAVRPVSVGVDGQLFLFGGHPGSIAGDMEICTALPEAVLKALLNDPAFLARPPPCSRLLVRG